MVATRIVWRRVSSLSSSRHVRTSRLNDPFAFLDCINPVDRRYVKFFSTSAGPNNFNKIQFVRSAQSKMQARVRTRRVTSATEDIAALAEPACRDKHLGSNGIARTLCAAHKLECDPVVRILHDVSKQRGRAINIIQHHVDVTVVEEIAKRRTSTG